jgi:hypothetical protein
MGALIAVVPRRHRGIDDLAIEVLRNQIREGVVRGQQ